MSSRLDALRLTGRAVVGDAGLSVRVCVFCALLDVVESAPVAAITRPIAFWVAVEAFGVVIVSGGDILASGWCDW